MELSTALPLHNGEPFAILSLSQMKGEGHHSESFGYPEIARPTALY